MSRFLRLTRAQRLATLAAALLIVTGLVWLLLIYLEGPKTSGYKSVVRLDFGTGECSGTIVGPRMVLTAAHCLGASSQPEVHIDDADPITATCFRHPDFLPQEPQYDVALCKLTADAGVLPHAISSSIPSTVNAAVTYVAYGRCWRFRSVRRYGSGNIKAVNSGVVEIAGSRICGGDSGGPVFLGGHGGHYPVTALLSVADDIWEPHAWAVSEDKTREWLNSYGDQLCFESSPSVACGAVFGTER
jgi:hypothetical protein